MTHRAPRTPSASRPDAPAPPVQGERSAGTLAPARGADVESAETEGLHRLLVDGVQDYGIFMLDPEGHVASWNDGAARIKGYTAEEIVGKHFSVFYPPDKVAGGFPQYELEVASSEGRFQDEGGRIRKEGPRFLAHVVITALRNAAGKLIGFGKVTRDLTERPPAEEQRPGGA